MRMVILSSPIYTSLVLILGKAIIVVIKGAFFFLTCYRCNNLEGYFGWLLVIKNE